MLSICSNLLTSTHSRPLSQYSYSHELRIIHFLRGKMLSKISRLLRCCTNHNHSFRSTVVHLVSGQPSREIMSATRHGSQSSYKTEKSGFYSQTHFKIYPPSPLQLIHRPLQSTQLNLKLHKPFNTNRLCSTLIHTVTINGMCHLIKYAVKM